MFEGVSSELPLRVARSMVLTHALGILGMLRVICFAVSFDLHMLLQLKVGELGGAATWWWSAKVWDVCVTTTGWCTIPPPG